MRQLEIWSRGFSYSCNIGRKRKKEKRKKEITFSFNAVCFRLLNWTDIKILSKKPKVLFLIFLQVYVPNRPELFDTFFFSFFFFFFFFFFWVNFLILRLYTKRSLHHDKLLNKTKACLCIPHMDFYGPHIILRAKMYIMLEIIRYN